MCREGCPQGGHGRLIANQAKRAGGFAAHIVAGLFVCERGDECGYGGATANPAQRFGCGSSDEFVLVHFAPRDATENTSAGDTPAKRLTEWVNGALITDPAERDRRRAAHARLFVACQCCLKCSNGGMTMRLT